MQIDLQQPLQVNSMVPNRRSLGWRRDGDAFFVTLVEASVPGDLDTVTAYYHGTPRIATANQGLGASVWWPTKDTQTDEPDDGQRIAITVPDPLVNVSNGRLRSVVNHPDGTTTWEWFVEEPINNYNVTMTAGYYARFGEFYQGESGELTLDYWPLDYHKEPARRQFQQVRPMLDCFEHWFGPYPWYRDGFKLIETPHLGMEHQSGIAYGNRYENGYLGRDLSGTGLGLDWDFIIMHESFADYVVGVRNGIRNDRPIVPEFGVNAQGSGDMYSKGGSLLHMVRLLIGDDEKWQSILRRLNETFRHSIVTDDRMADSRCEI